MTNRIGAGNQEALFARREAMAARLAQLNAARARLDAGQRTETVIQTAQVRAANATQTIQPTNTSAVKSSIAGGTAAGNTRLTLPAATLAAPAANYTNPAANAPATATTPVLAAPSTAAAAPDGGWDVRRSDFERLLEYLGDQAINKDSLLPSGGVVAGNFFDYGAGASPGPLSVEITQSAQSATLFLDLGPGRATLDSAASLELRGSSGAPVQLDFPAGASLSDIAAEINATPELGLGAFVEDGVLRLESIEPGSAEFVSVRSLSGAGLRIGQAHGDDARTPTAMTTLASGIEYSDLGQDIQGTVNGQRAGSYGNRLLAANGSYAVYLDLAMNGADRAAQTIGTFTVNLPT